MSLPVSVLKGLNSVFSPERAAPMSGAEQTAHEIKKAAGSMGRYLEHFAAKDIDVLDYGCGWGGETLWLADHVRSVVGFDVEQSSIDQALSALKTSGQANCTFICDPSGRIGVPDASFDAVFSTDTFEHVMDLGFAFREIQRVLRPGGLLVTQFGPLFYSPYGYHLRWACQVPWAHLIFGLQPVLELRNQCAGTTMTANTWEETGLNRRRFVEFKQAAVDAGLELRRFEALPVKGVTILTKIPQVRDLFIFGIDCVARKG